MGIFSVYIAENSCLVKTPVNIENIFGYIYVIMYLIIYMLVLGLGMLFCKLNGNFFLYAHKNTFMKGFPGCPLVKEEILRNEGKSIFYFLCC